MVGNDTNECDADTAPKAIATKISEGAKDIVG